SFVVPSSPASSSLSLHDALPISLRQLTAPQLVVPVAARDPSSGGLRGGKLADPSRELLRRGRITQVDAAELEAASDEVGVAVGEARHHEGAVELDDPGIRSSQCADLVIG